MSPIRDANLVIRSSTEGAVVSTDSTTRAEAFTLETTYGTPINGMALQVNVPLFTLGTSIFVEVLASTSTDPTTDEFIAQSMIINAAGEWIIPFVCKPNTSVKIIEANFAYTASHSDFTFGAVEAYVVENVGYSWAR